MFQWTKRDWMELQFDQKVYRADIQRVRPQILSVYKLESVKTPFLQIFEWGFDAFELVLAGAGLCFMHC